MKIIKISITPMQFLTALISGFISFYFIKNEIATMIPELSESFIAIISIIIVFSIELTIINSLFFGVKSLKDNTKLGLLLLSISIPLFLINFLFLSEGSKIIIEKQINKTEYIESKMNDSLNTELDKIDSRITKYEEVITTETKTNYQNWQKIRSNNDLARNQILLLQNKRDSIIKQIKAEKQLSLNNNQNKVNESKTRYYYFSIGLIILIIFFNVASGLLTYDIKNNSENARKNQPKITYVKLGNENEYLAKENKHLAEQVENLKDSKEKELLEQKELFIELMQVINSISSTKYIGKGVTKDEKRIEIERLEELKKELKRRIGINGKAEQKHESAQLLKKESQETDLSSDLSS